MPPKKKAAAPPPPPDNIAPDLASLARPIGTLRLDPENARRHEDLDIDAVAASLAAFGQQKPVVVREDGTIVAGNGTWQAAKRLGWKTIAASRFPEESGVGVGAKARAYGLADNRTAELSTWDEALRREALRVLDAQAPELLPATAFSKAEIDEILDRAALEPVGGGAEESDAATLVDADGAEIDDPDFADTSGDPLLLAPFPYFGGKRAVCGLVWRRFGKPKQYIEPFCGSAAMLFGAPEPCSLEVANDVNGFIANFWRAVKNQPAEVATWTDYPVSHVDLGARHRWLMEQRGAIGAALQDPNWIGDAQVAGWWLWGQCSWIGSGWCEWFGKAARAGGDAGSSGQIPRADAGVQAVGQIPHASNAGRGVQAVGQIPHASSPGQGVLAGGAPAGATELISADLLTSAGRTARIWLRKLSDRLERVRLVHGDWDRCLNHHYGAEDTAVFLDPPYRAYESLYGAAGAVGGNDAGRGVANAVEAWAKENANLRVALCGHLGDYPSLTQASASGGAGWEVVRWKRRGHTFGGSGTTAQEAIWFSPGCVRA